MKKRNLLNVLIIMFLTMVLIDQAYGQEKNRDWTIVGTYTIPGKAAGLAWDGSFLYAGLYSAPGDDNIIYKIDPADGTYTQQCIGPHDKAYGLSFYNGNLWVIDRNGTSPASAVEFDMSGTLVRSFTLSDAYMSGIAREADTIWACTYYPNPGVVYKMDTLGNILSQFAPPADQPWDICVENGNLWIADYDANNLYKTDKTGTILETHACENMKPAGVVYDGQYLWYVDGQTQTNSVLYKVDLMGSGTPAIDIPVTSFDYGNVTLTYSGIWEMLVLNDGTDTLKISNIDIPTGTPINTTISFPIDILPGNDTLIELTYEPTEFGALDEILTVESNDPVNPSVEVTVTGNAVYEGPYVSLASTTHDYGLVRRGAFTRWQMNVENRGDDLLNIDSISIDISNFLVEPRIEFPLSISTLESYDFGIWFNPTSTGPFDGTLTLYCNDAAQSTLDVTLSGQGEGHQYAMGEILWASQLPIDFDNSVKAIQSIPDVTGDNVPDVIIGDEDNFIRCFNGNASGTGDMIWEYSVLNGKVYNQNSLDIIEDINGDGYHDVLLAGAWGNRRIIAICGYTGAQIWEHDTHEYGDGGWVYQVHGDYDYNGDGIPDVLASTGDDAYDTGPKRIYCLDGLTGNSIWEYAPGGPNFAVIGIEDVNGDNIPDVFAGGSTNDESTGKVYGINGANGNNIWTYSTSSTAVQALLQIDDINGDGVKDVAAGDAGFGAGGYYYFDATDGAVLSSGGIGGAPLIINLERMDDVNSDGISDIAFGSSSTNAIVVDGTNGQNVWLQAMPDKAWNVSRISDIDGDGINDLTIGTLFNTNKVLFVNGTNGNELFSEFYSAPIDAISAIPDITDDGSMEVIVGGRDGYITCYAGGLSSSVPIIYVPETVHSYGVVDVGSSESWYMKIYNNGTQALIIDSLDLNDAGTVFTTSASFPITITPSSEDSLEIVFTPENTNEIIHDVVLSSNDLSNPEIEISLIGNRPINVIRHDNEESDILKLHPNPVSDVLEIQFSLEQKQSVTFEIFDLFGKHIITLESGVFQEGNYSVIWDLKDDSYQKIKSGLYLLRMDTTEGSLTKKFVVK